MSVRDTTIRPVGPSPVERDAGFSLAARYRAVRALSEALAAPLSAEDCLVQSMPDASPVKWHLAHASWFFETFLLVPHDPAYRPFDDQFNYLFNSYYNAVGARHPRPLRGLLTRPPLTEVMRYRRHVDEHMTDFLERSGAGGPLSAVVALGLNHEQQHQELILTDIKHAFAANPLRPPYCARRPPLAIDETNAPREWVAFRDGVHSIGHEGDGFAFDNEAPRHRVCLEPFRLATRLVTNAEYLDFLNEGGYERPEFWLSDGWNVRQATGWDAPIYWEHRDGRWWQMTLAGLAPVEPTEPVCHVSFYEADAFARWAGARLPTEAEWEVAAAGQPIEGNFLDGLERCLHPVPARAGAGLAQLYGDVWEWTASPYAPYPGYRPALGALGEYNGKFMCNQFVLRGGSCATPRGHIRPTYRNFFPPDARWQFAGIRLASEP